MGGSGPEERSKRVVLAQGLAALACFVAVHGAHGATPACTMVSSMPISGGDATGVAHCAGRAALRAARGDPRDR